MVNNPAHYTQGDIECIDAMQACSTPEEFKGYLRLQIIKYTWRMNLKGNPLQDLSKAQWYARKLHEVLTDEGEVFMPF